MNLSPQHSWCIFRDQIEGCRLCTLKKVSDGIATPDGKCLLAIEITFIHSIVEHEEGNACLRIAIEESPVQRRATAIPWEQ